MPTHHLEIDQLASGIQLCIENASSLIEDAELLYNHKRYPRAFSLAVLSIEELGKIPMLVRAACFEEDDSDKWTDFWKKFTDHEYKYVRSFGPRILGLSSVPNEELLKIIRDHQKKKLRGFYVDFEAKLGKFQLPRAQFTESDVKGREN